jgi:hypothetical protein
MKKAREFDDILNECIDRVLKGEPIEACLAAYPEHAAELEPLLHTALDTRKAAAVVPRPEFRQQAAYEFQAAIRNMKPNRSGFFRWQLRWVTAVSVVVIVLLAGSGTVAAASNSLPDEPLYPVKLATEDMRLTLTPSALGKAELYAEFADKRVDEIVKMADKGKVAQVVKATERMNDQLVAMANLALPAREAAIAEDEAPTALMAPAAEPATAPTAASSGRAPATTPAPTTTLKPTLAPTPPTTAKATPVPAPTSLDNKGQLSPSANLSSPKAAAQQEITLTQVPRVATATALKPAVAEKLDKAKVQANLKNTVSQQAEKNARQLEDVLKRVPDNVKAALEKAIDVADKGYDEALKNIDRKK